MKAREGGYYYEINRNHPLVEVLQTEIGNDNAALNSLLSQIERTLPLNQLYIDMNNDEHIENDIVQEEKEIEKVLKDMLPKGVSIEEKKSFLEKLRSIPPYKNFENVIDRVKKEIDS